MKRLISITTVIILLVLSLCSVYAAETVSFELSDCTTDNNRLFTVEMTANSDKPLSAVTFEFEYDKNMIEFRHQPISEREPEFEITNAILLG